MTLISRPSPNHDSRRGDPIDMLVLHYTDMLSCEEALTRLCDAEANVSAHYVISEAGEVFALVPEEARAWHAGESHWRGAANINSRSIGIELCNRGHSHDYPDFPAVQMQALIALGTEILGRHAIPPRNVVAHSDVAFLRKMDPGEKCDWRMLAKAGIGLFPNNVPPMSASEMHRGDKGLRVTRLQTVLSNWGYGLKLDGVFGEKTEACVRAFQRHYRPERVDGIWDSECASLLASLHGMV